MNRAAEIMGGFFIHSSKITLRLLQELNQIIICIFCCIIKNHESIHQISMNINVLVTNSWNLWHPARSTYSALASVKIHLVPTVCKTMMVRRPMYHSTFARDVRDGSYDWDNPRLAGGGDVYDDATQFHTNYYLLNCEEEEERLVVAIITTRMLSFRVVHYSTTTRTATTATATIITQIDFY